MNDKLNELKDYLLNSEGYSKEDVINDVTIDVLKSVLPKEIAISSDEIGLHWGDGFITDLDTFSNRFYDQILYKLSNVIDSFKEQDNRNLTSDEVYGFNIGDVIYISYMSGVQAGLYEVTAINPLWIKNDGDGSYNCVYHDIGDPKLVCKAGNREDR